MSDATRLSCPLENVSRLGCNFQLGEERAAWSLDGRVTSPRFISRIPWKFTRVIINDVAKNGISRVKFLRESSIISTFEEMYRANLSFPSFSFSRLFQHIPRTNVVEIKFPRESIIHVTRTTRPFILSSSRIFYCHKTQNLTFFFFFLLREIFRERRWNKISSWIVVNYTRQEKYTQLVHLFFQASFFFFTFETHSVENKISSRIVVDYTR